MECYSDLCFFNVYPVLIYLEVFFFNVFAHSISAGGFITRLLLQPQRGKSSRKALSPSFRTVHFDAFPDFWHSCVFLYFIIALKAGRVGVKRRKWLFFYLEL